MSAQSGKPSPKVSADLGLVAPAFAQAVRQALEECQKKGLDAVVFEASRLPELQALYYARGRTIIPPRTP